MPDPISRPAEVLVGADMKLTSRRAKAFASANRHSNLVRLLKFILPASAILICAGFVFVTMKARTLPDVDVTSLALQDGRIVMENPRLNGISGNNQPYTVVAARALQSVSDANDIKLEGITANMPFGNDATAELVAANGHLDNGKRILILPGGFNLTTSDGMVAKFEGAVFDFGSSSLKTDLPVDIKRPGTHIQADSMIVTDGGASLVFERRVRMIVLPQSLQQTGVTANGG